jgi:hypothetical protein
VRTDTVVAAGQDRRNRIGGEQPAATDDDEVVGEHGQLGDQVARHEHGATVVGERAQRSAQPADAVGVQAVGRFVEQQHVGSPQQRACQCETLAHAQREAAGALIRRTVEADRVEHVGHPMTRDAAEVGHGVEVVARRSTGVHAAGIEHRADDPCRAEQLWVADASVADLAAVRPREADHHPHGGRLAGAVRSDEAGDTAGGHLEREVVDHEARAVPLGEL